VSRPALISTAEGTSTHSFASTDWALFAGISLVWGASFLFIKNALHSFGPGTLALFRVGLGAATLALVPAARHARIDRADRPRFVLLGFIWMTVPLVMFPIAERWVSSAVAGMLNGANPLVTAVVASVLLQRRPGRSQLLGLAVGFVGIVLVALPSLQEGANEVRGVLCIVVALLGYGFSSNISVPLTQKYGSLVVQLRVQALGVVFSLPYGVYGLVHEVHVTRTAVLSMLGLGVLGTGLAFVLAGLLMARVGATRAMVFTYVIPVVSIVLGVVFLHEHVHALAYVGAGFVLAGAFLTTRAGH
jgi:drug/metabolite transporter (DMT)-like permease